MRTLSTYRVNQPTTSGGHSISVTTTIFGTEEEVEYIRRSCEETIGSGLIQEYNIPYSPYQKLSNDSAEEIVKLSEDYLDTGLLLRSLEDSSKIKRRKQ